MRQIVIETRYLKINEKKERMKKSVSIMSVVFFVLDVRKSEYGRGQGNWCSNYDVADDGLVEVSVVSLETNAS